MDSFLELVTNLEDHLWTFVGFPIIILLGLYFTYQSRFVQFLKVPLLLTIFYRLLTGKRDSRGIHPISAFFACVGGCVGIGNIVAICTAVQIGGPGALFWVWITALVGMMLKYAEVYLGLKYRVRNDSGSYNGGPYFYLKRACKTLFLPNLVCLLLCIYGIEIYQFNIMAQSIVINFNLNFYLVIAVLLALVMYAVSGGVRRVAHISSAVVPLFILLYVGMGGWVLLSNYSLLPDLIGQVFVSAFTGHAAVGGFAGSSVLMAISQGIRRGCYSSDVGVGYASVIHSESSVRKPERQASLVLCDVFLDIFVICTTSVLLILVTGVWQEPIHESLLIQTALSYYFPYMHYFMPFFLFLLGYSTIIAYFVVGVKCAEQLFPKHGRNLYYFYAIAALLTFSFVESREAIAVMAVTQILLLLINGYAFFKLRKEINYNFDAPSLPEQDKAIPEQDRALHAFQASSGQ
jgi:alanine or glycine:cation symporter, AGCS family